MNKQHKTNLIIILGGWLVICLACSSGGNNTPESSSSMSVTPSATPMECPTPFYDGGVFSPENAKIVRNAMGLDDGWVTAELKQQKQDKAKYEKKLSECREFNKNLK